MDMVIKESMRLYPSAPSTIRKLNQRADIGGFSIPEGTIIMVKVKHILNIAKLLNYKNK